MRRYTVRIFFNDGTHISVDCDDFIIGNNGCYVATRDGLRVITLPFRSVKYTTLIQNH